MLYTIKLFTSTMLSSNLVIPLLSNWQAQGVANWFVGNSKFILVNKNVMSLVVGLGISFMKSEYHTSNSELPTNFSEVQSASR